MSNWEPTSITYVRAGSEYRNDKVYLIITVLKTINNYEIRKRSPKSLAQNQFCYELSIQTDMKDWVKRIKSVDLGKTHAPHFPDLTVDSEIVEEDVPTQVMNRLKGDK